jgi:hypothetical protein
MLHRRQISINTLQPQKNLLHQSPLSKLHFKIYLPAFNIKIIILQHKALITTSIISSSSSSSSSSSTSIYHKEVEVTRTMAFKATLHISQQIRSLCNMVKITEVPLKIIRGTNRIRTPWSNGRLLI